MNIEEITQLRTQELLPSKEIKDLEEILREEFFYPKEYETTMQKWLTLVNQKHDMVRRHMQINVKEKEKRLTFKLAKTRKQLRYFSELKECRKTEEDKTKEETLLNALVDLVNKKNALIIQLDEQECFIADDERIKDTFIGRSCIQLEGTSPYSTWKKGIKKWLTF